MNARPAEQPNEWIQRSEYDIETAEAMLKTGRYLYVAFCCQQSVEKRLKAIIADKTGKIPPRIHNLVRLAQLADIEPSQVAAKLLRQLNLYYIEGRYPEEMSKLADQIDRDLAGRILKDAKECLSWLVQQKN